MNLYTNCSELSNVPTAAVEIHLKLVAQTQKAPSSSSTVVKFSASQLGLVGPPLHEDQG
jgi:hypothetical protein